MTQNEALDILKLGHNVYLTGSAGSGKTFLLNKYISYLKRHNVSVAITASTGIAATHINGITIHSWSGLGVRDVLSEQELDELERRRYLWDRIQNTKVLIIDEVSMLHHFRLDLVEKIVRTLKRNDAPFGGLQVVLCGDFFQLPPVQRAGELAANFVYKSDAWRAMNFKICYLQEQHRQTDDVCLKVLNDIRSNSVSEDTLQLLRYRYKQEPKSLIQPTRLYTHNVDVDLINNQELEAITEKSRIFEMTDRGNKALVLTLKKSCLAPETLRLKRGARVMFVKNNYEAGYVNGTLGRVIDFDLGGPVIKTARGVRIIAKPVSWVIEEDGKVKAEISQIPLRLAWAITVHKSQGMSLDAMEVDLSKSFEKGMGYVALSRVCALDGLKLLGLNEIALQVNDEVIEFDKDLKKRSDQLAESLRKMDLEEKINLQNQYLAFIAPKIKIKKKKISTYDETKALISQKLSIMEIAKKRGMTEGTIIGHLEKLIENERLDPAQELRYLKFDQKRFNKIKSAFEMAYEKSGELKLSPVRDLLGQTFDFNELRLVRLFLKMR